MRWPRFSLLSVTAMMCATALAAIAVVRTRGAVGFSAHQGFPFAWYWYTDFTINNDPGYGYWWGGLALDVVIWFFAVMIFRSFVEYITQGYLRLRGPSTHAEPDGVANR